MTQNRGREGGAWGFSSTIWDGDFAEVYFFYLLLSLDPNTVLDLDPTKLRLTGPIDRKSESATNGPN